MATDRLINQTQGEDIIDRLNEIASNVNDIKFGPQSSSSDVVSMTGYEKASASDSISQGDTLNQAIGKLEYKTDANATAVADRVISPNANADETIPVFNGANSKTVKDSGVKIVTTADTTKDNEVPTSKAVNTVITGKGYVAGPVSSTAGHIPTFSDTSGKVLADSYAVTTSITDSATALPTSGAVKTQLDTKIDTEGTGLSKSGTTLNHSNSVTAVTTAGALKVKYDAQGHITGSDTLSASDISAVPTSRTVNGSALSSDVTLNGNNVNLSGSYAIAGTAALPAASDKIDVAVGKLAKTAQTNQTNILSVADANGEKNIINFTLEKAKKYNTYGTWSGNVYTYNGIKFTVNSDGTVGMSMVSDTTTHERAVFWIDSTIPNSYSETYVISGGNVNAAADTFSVAAEETSSPWSGLGRDYGNTGAVITRTNQATYGVYIGVKANYVISDTEIIKPMICKKSLFDASPTYQPYSLPNTAITPELIELCDSGAKNLVDCSVDNIKALNSTSSYSWNGNTVTAKGRTATVNADKTITVAAGTGTGEFWLKVANYAYASGVSYVLSGCPTNGSTTTYYMESDNLNLRDIGSGVVINSATTDALYIVVKTTGATPALTFKPMICTQAAWNVSHKYVPYRPNWDLVSDAIYGVSGTITALSADITIANGYIKRICGVVYFAITVKSSNAISANTTVSVGTVNSEFRKTYVGQTMFSCGVDGTSDVNCTAWMSYGTNEQVIKFRTATALEANKNFYITGFYPCG